MGTGRRRRQVGRQGGSPMGWIVLALVVGVGAIALVVSSDRGTRTGENRPSSTTIYQTVMPSRAPAPPHPVAAKPSAKPHHVSASPAYPRGVPNYAPRTSGGAGRPTPASPTPTPASTPTRSAATPARPSPAQQPGGPPRGGPMAGSPPPPTETGVPGYDRPRPSPSMSNPIGIGSTPADGGRPKGY